MYTIEILLSIPDHIKHVGPKLSDYLLLVIILHVITINCYNNSDVHLPKHIGTVYMLFQTNYKHV